MKSKASFWERMGLHEWFLKKEHSAPEKQLNPVTPHDVFHYILQQFNESIKQLSFANRVIFYHEYIICFNEEDYQKFRGPNEGIFLHIVQECIKEFSTILRNMRSSGKTVVPSASKWVFRFVSHPEYARGDKGFIGKLLPGAQQKEENLRVTFIPRQTGIAQTFDINPEILKDFTFYSEGYYEMPYQEDLTYDENKIRHAGNSLARFEAILPDKAGSKLEYLMRDEEIIVCGKEEKREEANIFRIPSEWVNTPHLRIKHDRAGKKFYLASFGEKTLLNEKEVARSHADHPAWTELPVNSRIMLNGIVGINIFKS